MKIENTKCGQRARDVTVKLLIPGEESLKKEDEEVRELTCHVIHGDTRQNEDGQQMGE